jgi:hypothetical protein
MGEALWKVEGLDFGDGADIAERLVEGRMVGEWSGGGL